MTPHCTDPDCRAEKERIREETIDTLHHNINRVLKKYTKRNNMISRDMLVQNLGAQPPVLHSTTEETSS